MYEAYYQFRRQPFSATPDPEFLFESEVHARALEQLLRGVRRREGVLLLTGDVGTGKTTTARALVRLLGPDVFSAVLVNPFVRADELLRALLQDFGVVSDGDALRDASQQRLAQTLNRFLLSLAAVGATALAVVDEAQNLAPPVLEQLRVLTGLETDQQKLLQVLLVGQPELQTALAASDMRPLNQRIARRCTLRPLHRGEVEQYVRFRMGLAREASNEIFTERALDSVSMLSMGVPRNINLLCDRSLEIGFVEQSPTVDDTLVTKAATALELLPNDPASIESPPHDPRPNVARPGPQSRTPRWVAAAVGISAGLGIGTALTTLGRWAQRFGRDNDPRG